MKHKTYKQLYKQEDLVQNGQLREFQQNHRPTNFIVHNKAKEMLVKIVNVTQLPQASGASKSQTKFVLDVGGLHFAPNIIIVFVIHALHLFIMANWKTNGREFKDDVIVKCDGQKGDILNFDLVVVQKLQLVQ